MGELTQREDEWQQRATAAAIAAARRVVLGNEAAVNMNTPVGRLSDIEWGWIVAAAIFAWIATRAEQATAEGLDTERAIRVTGFARGEPWDAGAIAAILPELGDDASIDWSQPLAGVVARDHDRLFAEVARAGPQGGDRQGSRRRHDHPDNWRRQAQRPDAVLSDVSCSISTAPCFRHAAQRRDQRG